MSKFSGCIVTCKRCKVSKLVFLDKEKSRIDLTYLEIAMINSLVMAVVDGINKLME